MSKGGYPWTDDTPSIKSPVRDSRRTVAFTKYQLDFRHW